MPYSKLEGKREVMSYLKSRFVRDEDLTILDIGAGAGAYGKLCREEMPGARRVAVEIFEPYRERFGLDAIYDRVIIADILKEDFDFIPHVVIFGDVLEHMERKDAIAVLKKYYSRSAVCVVSIPIIDFPQGESDGNIHETHLNQWSFDSFASDMEESGIRVRLRLKGRVAGVYILSEEPPPFTQRAYWAARQAVHTYGAFAKSVRRKLKNKNPRT